MPKAERNAETVCVCPNLVVQLLSCVWLCDPMDCSMPGFPVLHSLLQFAQTHVHWFHDAVLSSHPLPSPCPFTFNLFKHQCLFQWVSSLHQVTKVLVAKVFFLYYLPAVYPESMDPGALGQNPLQPQHLWDSWSILQVCAFPGSLPSSLCS